MLLLEAVPTNPDILGELAKQGILPLAMGGAITWLIAQLKKKDNIIQAKDEQIEKDQRYIRENDKENLKVLSELNQTIDKLIESQRVMNEKTVDNQKNNTDLLAKEIQNMRDFIDVKIQTLNNKLDGK